MASKTYIRPIHFVDSPQLFDGEPLRLAGGMLWFNAVEIITKDGNDISRSTMSVQDWEAACDKMNEDRRHADERIRQNLISPRAGLKMGERVIRFDQPQVMGILNATPDSFSDGGKHVDVESAVAAGFDMSAAGAAIIDVGGESTRPGAHVVWEGDETQRIEPIIRQLAAGGAAVSIDTRKAAVMEAATAAGAHMINDISALIYDDRSVEVARMTGCPVVLMHAPGQGSDPHKGKGYQHALLDIYDWLEARVEAVVAQGIAREQILIDPGLGFGYGDAKTLGDDLMLINNLSLFHGIGCPIVFGASRKRMIGALSNEAPAKARLGGSIYLAMKAIEQGAQIIRVHDVPETVQAIHVWRGLRDAALTERT